MMLTGLEKAKSTPRKQLPASKSRYFLVRFFMDHCYRDPYRRSMLKCVAFFAAGIWVARLIDELQLLPAEAPTQAVQSPY